VGILQEILKEIKGEDNTETIRKLCDQITIEEKKNIKNYLSLPKGPNIFLALEVPGRTGKEIAFLILERESEDKYLSVLYTILKIRDRRLKRQMVWEINDHRPEKILTEYVKKYKFLRGE
jgi:hypothetical protein